MQIVVDVLGREQCEDFVVEHMQTITAMVGSKWLASHDCAAGYRQSCWTYIHMCIDETTNFLRLRSSFRRLKEVSGEEHLAFLNKGAVEDKKKLIASFAVPQQTLM